MKNRLLFAIFAVYSITSSLAQSLPVGSPVLEDYYRNQQLLGNIDSLTSFTMRPLLQYPYSDSSLVSDGNSRTILQFGRGEGIVKVLPLNVIQQYNSHHPYGWNDGAMVPAKGYQSLISLGVFMQYGPLSIQLQPEFVHAQNKDFEEFPHDYPDMLWARYYDYYYNRVDLPERPGSGNYNNVLWGQSSIRLNFDPVSFGVSNENLWWGPGSRNSLLMSNTATGFKHFTFNTSKPVQTPAGSIEGQMIAGVLENSGFLPPESDRTYNGIPVYEPPYPGRRLLSGIILTYQPKWAEGLFLGYSRTSQIYRNDTPDMIGEIPLFLPFKKFMADDNTERKNDQYISLFSRWLFTKANGEIYFEYGWNNHPYIFENVPEKAARSGGYTFGLKKLLPRKKADSYMEVNLEVSQLQPSGGELNKIGESWYVNNHVRAGYTHKGSLLGAGMGPGGNLQSLEVNWLRGMKKTGIQLERFMHNNDVYYYLFENIRDGRRHWLDLSIGAHINWDFKNILIDASLKGIQSWDYQYYQYVEDIEIPYVPGRDVFNLHGRLGVSYRF